MTVCNDCGGTVIEYDTAAGNGICVKCGTVVEENSIVSEVTFGETSSGAAMVQGSYVAQGSTHARMSGPFGNRGSNDSREQTIANANRKIQSIATVLRLSEVVCLAATRLYTLAVEHRFTKGRKSLNVVAVCLYVACRQKETRNYMLIDFSDLLQVNVFELGHTYLQLVHTLNLRLPLIDPSHYISRFSALLEFGDDTHKVAHDAVRLVQRFDRDWMTKGRRPAGICGAALLLAARMNNFRRSMEEIIQVVKIADTTLKKRLEEFARTSSAGLTVVDFRRVWLEEEMDPPAFFKGKEREEGDGVEAAEEENEGDAAKSGRKTAKSKGKLKVKRKRIREDGEYVVAGDAEGLPREPPRSGAPPLSRPPIDPALFNQGILAGTIEPEPLFMPTEAEDPADRNIDPALLPPLLPPRQVRPSSPVTHTPALPPTSAIDETANVVLTEEVASFLENIQGAQLRDALAEAEERRLMQIQQRVIDDLTGLDEEELDRLLLSEQEVRIKERVWVEMNKDYLEGIAAKAERELSGTTTAKTKKRRKTGAKSRDAATPHASSAAESVRNLLKKNPKYSKRINYDALKDLFVDGSSIATVGVIDEKDEDEKDRKRQYCLDEKNLYAMDGGSDGEEIVVEEEGGAVGGRDKNLAPVADEDEDAEGEEDLDDIVLGSWEDAYEQEV